MKKQKNTLDGCKLHPSHYPKWIIADLAPYGFDYPCRFSYLYHTRKEAREKLKSLKLACPTVAIFKLFKLP